MLICFYPSMLFLRRYLILVVLVGLNKRKLLYDPGFELERDLQFRVKNNAILMELKLNRVQLEIAFLALILVRVSRCSKQELKLNFMPRALYISTG